ncbi:Thrombospondin type-1 (TSP1) repeat [Trinorchestia longiramus]|nr:Thrombospondin type-1 (TSP1) repeat [Trinorchestia longiramus]
MEVCRHTGYEHSDTRVLKRSSTRALTVKTQQEITSEYVDPGTPHTIVYPVRVDHLGQTIEKDQNWRERSKRETLVEYPDEAEHNHRESFNENHSHRLPTTDDSEIFVKIDNAEDDLLLQLRPNRNLRLQGTVVEWVLPNGATILKAAPENCFMVGRTVGNEKQSLVAVSGCSGFTGLIQSGHNSYFIEPLKAKHVHPKFHQSFSDNIYSSDVHRTEFTPKSPNDSIPLEPSRKIDEGYREQTGSLNSVTLPEPHVMYKVDSILRQLNISLHEDQKFEWDGFNKGGRRRQKRSSRLRRDDQGPPNEPRKDKGFVRKTASRTSKGKASGKKKSRDKRRKKRNRRHNRKNREIRQRCRELKAGHSAVETTFDSLVDAIVSEDISLLDSEMTLESFLALCEQEEERRNRRRHEREERKQAREMRLKTRETRRQAREEKKRLRQERRNRRKEQSQQGSPSSSASVPWSTLNGSEWHGGYSPDLPWEVAQPAHSPSILEEDLSFRDTSSPPPSPRRWLEITVAVDSSIIDFHGEDNTEQYIFTLFNIVSAIYQDPSLAARLELVLLRLICYTDSKHSQVRAGEAKSSLEAVNRWASRLHHASQTPLKHDLAVWLTRLPLGGPSGYAPVGGVCHPARSCTLNRDEGLTSAFIIAHEMGHVLGLSHDGDSSSSNTCVSEGLMGSVMAPLVAATFTNFHWSRCSRTEYLNLVSSWDCMTTPPSWANATTVSSVISYHYSLDDQCRMEFGEGYGLCRSFGLSDSCSHLWCANKSTSHLCKTKKGPPLEGTVCGEGKWCRFGVCSSRSTGVQSTNSSGETSTFVGVDGSPSSGSPPVRHNPQHGGWSSWTDWGPCSVTCGPGVSFRSRSCDNPMPRWGGKSCRGKKEEWRVCGRSACDSPTDVRANHCSQLSNLVELDQRMSQLDWLPYEPKSKRLKCRVSCYSRATNEMYLGQESLRDGSPCSYDSPSHHICVQGKCVELGCDLRLGSGEEEDACGECGGDGSSCFSHSERYFGIPGPSYEVVTLLPAGARHVSVQEEENSSNFLALARMGNNSQWSSLDFPLSEEAILLNPDHHSGPARSFVTEGALFHYNHRGEKESILARGPLLYEVAVLIHGGGVESPVHVTSSYYVPNSRYAYHWFAGPLGPCSTTCGGGEQRPQLECVEEESSKRVSSALCSSEPVPSMKAVPCNTFSCNVMWSESEWEHCSATCGSHGVQQRVVSCVAVDEPQVPIDPVYCPADSKPPQSRVCNQHPCPAYWHLSGWTECEGECGRDGKQEALWSCPQPTHSHASKFEDLSMVTSTDDFFVDCGEYPSIETRTCTVACDDGVSKSSDCEDERNLSSASDIDERFLSSLTSNSIDENIRFPVNSTRCNSEETRTETNSSIRNDVSDKTTTFEEHDHTSTNSVSIISNPFSKNSFLVPRKLPSSDITKSKKDREPSSSQDQHPNISSASKCSEDVSSLCKLPSLRKYCSLRGYKKLCCSTCALLVRN